jgi:hypothetical protein
MAPAGLWRGPAPLGSQKHVSTAAYAIRVPRGGDRRWTDEKIMQLNVRGLLCSHAHRRCMRPLNHQGSAPVCAPLYVCARGLHWRRLHGNRASERRPHLRTLSSLERFLYLCPHMQDTPAKLFPALKRSAWPAAPSNTAEAPRTSERYLCIRSGEPRRTGLSHLGIFKRSVLIRPARSLTPSSVAHSRRD